ncbi:MAG: TadE family protein [Varibaculum sp.]|nr:TadE family protein [Varibaculum sp.]
MCEQVVQSGFISRNETGSTLVESLLTIVMVVFLTLALLQVGYAGHVRATMVAVSGEAARRVALVGGTPEEGRARIEHLMVQLLPGAQQPKMDVQVSSVRGREIVTVKLRAAVPIIGPWGVPGTLETSARAFREPQ